MNTVLAADAAAPAAVVVRRKIAASAAELFDARLAQRGASERAP